MGAAGAESDRDCSIIEKKVVKHMKVIFETDNEDSRMVSIDDIIAVLIDKEAENPKKSYFDFIKVHDSSILTKIKQYTMDVKDKDFSSLDEFQAESVIEDTATDLTDTITRANFDYLKHGMKLGVRMLFELMV